MFNVKQMKTNKFIKYIWKWIISTLNATLEVPILQVINLYESLHNMKHMLTYRIIYAIGTICPH